MREIGIALGEKEAGVVIIEDKKVAFSKRYVFNEEELGNMEVAINKLRRILSIRGEDRVYLALPEKKIILRSFKLPLMGKKELEGGISFEIEKYIPFEIDELIWDYAYVRIPNEKKILISFLAIKKEEFKQFKEIFATVDVNLSLLEPGFFSLYRIIKSKKDYSKCKGIGILELTPLQGSFTIFFKNLPLFNHTFLIKDFASDSEFLKEKIREELRFSFQYFRREFSEFSLERLIVIAKENFLQEREFFLSLKEELEVSIEIEMTSVNRLVKLEEDLNVLKAYGAAEFNYLPVRFPSFRKTEGFLCMREEKKEFMYIPFVAEVILGFFFLIGLNVFFQAKINNLERKIEEKSKKLSSLPFKDRSRKFIENEIERRKKAIERLKNGKLKSVLFIFKSIEETLPEGMWLENLKIDFEKKKGFMSGYVCLDNSYREEKTIDKFVRKLNKNEKIKSFFSSINIATKRKQLLKEIPVTYFKITLGKKDEK